MTQRCSRCCDEVDAGSALGRGQRIRVEYFRCLVRSPMSIVTNDTTTATDQAHHHVLDIHKSSPSIVVSIWKVGSGLAAHDT